MSRFYEDTRSPVLVSFDLDMDSNMLLLTFNETVMVNTLSVTEITLQDHPEMNETDPNSFRRLQGGPAITDDDTVLIIALPISDVNYIKRYTNLATNESNTFISFSNLTLTDMNGNPVTSVPADNASQVAVFTPDTTSPFILYYELNLTSEELFFVFDETVNINSFTATSLTLVSGPGSNSTAYQLTGGEIVAEQNDTTFSLILTTSDLNEIKKLEDLATSSDNTFLEFDAALLTDMNTNYVVPIIDQPLQTLSFTPDTVQPELLSYHLDMNTGLLHLSFSETVRVSTLHAPSFTFQNFNDSSNTSYTLVNGSSVSSNGPEITLIISTLDLNNIKRITTLATSISDTFLTIESMAIDDMSGNNVTEIVSSDGQQAADFTEDTTNPTLISFDLDLNSHILWLTFDETVNVSSLEAVNIVLVNSDATENITVSLPLSTSDVIPGAPDDPVVPVLLSRIDSNEVKRLTELATSENNTFLLVESEAILDMNSNFVNNVTVPFSVTVYTEDTTKPELETFVVDMDSRMLILYFSETVNVSSLQVNGITLQDASTAIGPTITLSPPTEPIGNDNAIIPIMLSIFDGNYLTSLTNLYNDLNDSYVRVTNFTVLDMNDNELVPLSDGEAIRASAYNMDVTNASLLNFTVDLDNWTVTLFFDETVALDTIDYTKFHIYSDEIGTINLTLTNGSFNLPYTHEVILYLTESDVCAIKTAEYLWTNVNDTWLYVEPGAVYDWTMMNPLNEDIVQAAGDPIEELPPNLVSYAVNLTSGVIILNFDEPVRPLTLVYQKILLQSSSLSNYTDSYRLSGGFTPSMNGKRVEIQIRFRDLNAIKAHTELYTDVSNTFLTLENGTIRDMVFNPSAPVEGFPVSIYMNDTNDPRLVEYSIDMDAGQLFLTFSETVDVSSFDLPSFTLQSDSQVSYSNPMAFHTFSEETEAFTSDLVEMLDSRIVFVNISLNDLNEIKRKRIANSPETTWIAIAAGALVDNNLQSVVPILNGINTIQVTNYTDDTTSPVLESYDLSLNEGTLTLFFSETVDATTLDVRQLTLLNAQSEIESSQSHTLTSSSLYMRQMLTIDGPGSMLVSGSGIISGSGSGSGMGGSINDSFFMIPEFGGTSNETEEEMVVMLGGSGTGSASGISTDRFRPLSSFNSPVLTIHFSHFDLNTIKALTELATSDTDTFLSLTTTAVRDMVGNFVEEVNTSQPLEVTNYTVDRTKPQLRGFSFDLDAGNLTLTFTETVNVTSLDVTQLTLINMVCNGTNYTLTALPPYPNTSVSFSADWPIVVVQIGHEDLDSIKNLRDLASGRRNTLLYLTEIAVWDNAGNSVVPLSSCEAPRARDFTHDTTHPKLVSFDLDLDDGRLILTFSETVKIVDTLSVNEITLQSTEEVLNSDLSEYTLSSIQPFASSSIDDDSRVVTVMLGFRDLNAIKYRYELATSRNDTYISITKAAVDDLNNNQVIAVPQSEGLQARIVTPDTTSPILVNFTLDMDSTTLTLNFNETVNSSSLMVDQIAILNNESSSSEYHSSPRFLTGGPGQTYTSSDNDHVIVIHLGPLDRNEIKRRRNLAIDQETSFLTVSRYTICDMNGNKLTPIRDGSAQQAADFVPDETAPVIKNFTVDMNEGRFILTFDETVMATSLILPYITFQDGENFTNITLTLTGGQSSQSDSTILEVEFSIDNLNEIKRLTLCRERDNCFLLHRYMAVEDMNMNYIEARFDGFGLQVAEYIPDITGPELVRFDTDLTLETITLTFSETVNASSLNFSAFTLQDFFEGTYSFTLTDGVTLGEDSTVIKFSLSLDDLNAIKRNTDIFTDRTNSWLTITDYAIHDMALIPNYVMPISNTTVLDEGIVTTVFIEDMIQPQLWSFDLNLTSDELTLYFSETVLARSLNISEITLQNRQSSATQSHTLQMGDPPLLSVLPSEEDYHILTVRLGKNDTNILKAFTDLATHENNLYVSITSNMVDDMNRNSIVPIPVFNAKRVDNFYEDLVRPEVLGFEFDLDAGQLVLTFSETVNASSLQVEYIQIQSTADGSGTTWQLTPVPRPNTTGVIIMDPTTNSSSGSGSGILFSGSGMNMLGSGSGSFFGSGFGADNDSINDTTSSNETSVETLDIFAPYFSFTEGPDHPILFVQLGFIDLNRLKQLTTLTTSLENSFISVMPEAISDMNGNPVVEVPPYDGVQASEFIMDSTNPMLVSFSLNLTSEVLSLTFDETVNASSLRPTSITVQQAEYTHLVSLISWYQLQGGEGSPTDDYIIDIQLDDIDLNELKRLTMIATSRENTYITITPELASDMSGNQVNEIINGRGLQVSSFFEDLTAPVLNEFHLDMDEGELHLTFSETVNAMSFDVTHITLQDGRTDLMNRTRQLTPESYDILGTDDTVISIRLGNDDLNSIKATEMFGLSTTDTWIVINDQLVHDMNMNPVVSIPDGEALQANNYTPDTTRPMLVSYHFDFILEEMTLHFTEPVNVSMISYTSITIQDGRDPDDYYTLTGGTAIASDFSLTIVISFDEGDIDFFKMHPSLTTSVDDTYLTFTSDSFYDLATVPNPIVPIINGTQVATFTYYESPVFMSVRPIAGRAAGGTELTITGGYFGDLEGYEEARQVDVLIDFVLAINTTVVEYNTTLSAITPAISNPSNTGLPVTLTITIDNSALMLNISEAFTYLDPPEISSVFPSTATQFGGTLLFLTGLNFGPSEFGPEVLVFVGKFLCENVTVINNTALTCISPSVEPGIYNLTVSVDEVLFTLDDVYRSIAPPTVTSITPDSTFRSQLTYVNITGTNFGPRSQSQSANPLQVFFVSESEVSNCTDPEVLVDNVLLSCLAQPNLGPSSILVVFDSVDSLPSDVVFYHFDNAGNFSFENAEFTVSERALFANVTVIRHDYPPYPSPSNISIQAYDGSAISGKHFTAANLTAFMEYDQNSVIFRLEITFGSYQPDKLRKGFDDDLYVNLEISEVGPLHGEADIVRESSILTIKAVCQVVTHVCVADWSIEANSVVYYRIDELP